MRFTDEQLLDFDKSELPNWERQMPAAALEDERAEWYRSQLAVAKFLEGWAARFREHSEGRGDDRFAAGFNEGLMEVVVRLRQGDVIPGGVAYRDWLA